MTLPSSYEEFDGLKQTVQAVVAQHREFDTDRFISGLGDDKLAQLADILALKHSTYTAKVSSILAIDEGFGKLSQASEKLSSVMCAIQTRMIQMVDYMELKTAVQVEQKVRERRNELANRVAGMTVG